MNFFLLIILFTSSLSYSTYKYLHTEGGKTFYLDSFLISLAILLTLILVHFFFKKTKTIIVIIVYSILFSLISFEIYLSYKKNLVSQISDNSETYQNLAKRDNISWDSRSKIKVLEDIKKNNNFVHSHFFPLYLLTNDHLNGIDYQGKKIFPLSGISFSTSILGNELGFFPIIKNDRYGFTNPDSVYDSDIDYVLIGDSFVEGCCTHQSDSFAGNLRKKNLNVLSLGKDGAGPLTEFAILNEYLLNNNIKYNNILWFFSANDLQNLDLELQSDLLIKYLDDFNFSQQLINRQDEVDKALINFLQNEKKKKLVIENINIKSKFDYKNFIGKIINHIKLLNIRIMLQLQPGNKNIKEFENIIKKSYEVSMNNNSKFYFVYLPNTHYFLTGEVYQFKKDIFKILNKLKIDIIDLSIPFKADVDPLRFWPFRCCGHYNEIGYNTASEYLYNYISEKK